jgi:hypothetical protein
MMPAIEMALLLVRAVHIQNRERLRQISELNHRTWTRSRQYGQSTMSFRIRHRRTVKRPAFNFNNCEMIPIMTIAAMAQALMANLARRRLRHQNVV